MYRYILTAGLALLLSGCATSGGGSRGVYYQSDGPPERRLDASQIPDAVPRVEPRSRGGNPKSYVIFGKRYYVKNSSKGYVERGIASWYGKQFHGRRTSNGEIYDMYKMTAAHKTLPIPTYVQVTNIKTGKQIVVRINDRGPFLKGRIIDLSYAAAQKLGIAAKGTGLVEVRAIDPRNWKPGTQPAAKTADTSRAHPEAQIYLQLGAFSQRSNAEKVVLKTVASAISGVFIKQGQDGYGKPIYRVRIGPLANVSMADDMMSRLLKTGVGEFHVVIE